MEKITIKEVEGFITEASYLDDYGGDWVEYQSFDTDGLIKLLKYKGLLCTDEELEKEKLLNKIIEIGEILDKNRLKL